jgi:uncharacterized protein (TIGR02246 family)
MTETAAEQLTRLMEATASAWNAADMAALGEVFAEDADFVDTSGTVVHGRDAIGAAHAQELAGPLAGSRLENRALQVRELADGVAVAIARNVMEPMGRSVLMTLVAARGADAEWRIVSAHSSLAS